MILTQDQLLLWVLPSLCTGLLFLFYARFSLGKLEDGATEDWWMWFIASVIYPIGAMVLLFKVVWPFLIKERSITPIPQSKLFNCFVFPLNDKDKE
jgi:hypothetical protein